MPFSTDSKQERIQAIDHRWQNYTDGDIFVINNINELCAQGDNSLSTNKVIIVVCYQGSLNLKLNVDDVTVSTGEIAICYPDIVINETVASEDMKCLAFGFSLRAMDNAFYSNEQVWQTLFDTSHYFILSLSEDQIVMLFHFSEIVKLANKDNALHKRMMHSLLQAVLYEFFDIIPKSSSNPEVQDTELNRRNIIFKRFIELLGEYNGRMRLVSDFAETLCISPKYLSVVVRACSNKTPMEWIQQHTTNIIIQELRYTDKSIKDISYELGFQSQAFFGKFVKKRLGMSPRAYRKTYHK